MRNFLLIIFTLVFFSCEKKNDYRITTGIIIPDSLKEKHREYIKELTRAADQHLSAGEMEDAAYTIRQSKWTADELFGVRVQGLSKYTMDFIPPEQMTEEEKKIFEELKKEQKL
jgi:DNA replication initiation complex subunit (GINS family)